MISRGIMGGKFRQDNLEINGNQNPMGNNGGYGIIYNSVIHSVGCLSGEAKLIYCVLCTYADEKRQCFPTVKTISENSGFSKKRTEKALKELKEAGVIETVRQSKLHGSNMYYVHDAIRTYPQIDSKTNRQQEETAVLHTPKLTVQTIPTITIPLPLPLPKKIIAPQSRKYAIY
jgi:hypothetical protein